jgi:hypothetical protein
MVEFINAEQFDAMREEGRVLVATLMPSEKQGCTHVEFHVEGPGEYRPPLIQPGNVKTVLVDEVLITKAQENKVSFIHKR